MVSIEAMFALNEEHEEKNTTELPINRIFPYPNQPFETYDSQRISELADDIRIRGLDNPLIVRKMPDGNYQIIAGHNRFLAIKKLGWTRVPVSVKELSDSEAAIYLVQSNLLQRTNIKESEKVKAYSLRAKALKKQGQKLDSKYSSIDIISQSESIKPRTLSRYITCAALNQDLLDLMDQKKISLNIGEQLSKLNNEQQLQVANFIINNEHKLSLSEAKKIVDSRSNDFDLESLILSSEKEQNESKSTDKIDRIFKTLCKSEKYQNLIQKDGIKEDFILSLLTILDEENIL
jgi:hypothetical protein